MPRTSISEELGKYIASGKKKISRFIYLFIDPQHLSVLALLLSSSEIIIGVVAIKSFMFVTSRKHLGHC